MSDPEGRPCVKDAARRASSRRAYLAGRLDFATSGVLLATNDGDFAEALMHPRKAVPKTYVVKVHGQMKPEDLDRWRRGVELEDGKTLPARAKLLRYEGDKTWFELTITEGRNQQVRRMGDATGFRVMRLARMEVAKVTGEGLRPGEWRYLTVTELEALKKEHWAFHAGSCRRRCSRPPGRGRRGVRPGRRPAARRRATASRGTAAGPRCGGTWGCETTGACG